MAAYGANYGGEVAEDGGSQFSGQVAGAEQAFGGFPFGAIPYGASPYGAAFPAGAFAPTAFPAGAYPTAFAGAAAPVFDQTAFAAAPAAFTYGVPAAVPVPVRKPGYNERYVAWKNRQKAFNSYKKATKEAIKNARNIPTNTYALAPATTFVQGATFAAAPTAIPTAIGYHHAGFPAGFPNPQTASYYAGAAAATGLAAPGFGYGFEQFGAFPYGYGFAAPAPASFAGDFTSYSEQSQGQIAAEPAAQEEPEIRGTQV